eukprot:1180766-Prorocentrum_minimum.AAC.1
MALSSSPPAWLGCTHSGACPPLEPPSSNLIIYWRLQRALTPSSLARLYTYGRLSPAWSFKLGSNLRPHTTTPPPDSQAQSGHTTLRWAAWRISLPQPMRCCWAVARNLRDFKPKFKASAETPVTPAYPQNNPQAGQTRQLIRRIFRNTANHANVFTEYSVTRPITPTYSQNIP